MVQTTRLDNRSISSAKHGAAYLRGKSGLIHAPTGTGKTYAVSIPPLIEWLNEFPDKKSRPKSVPLRLLWITPLRALANDTAQSILAPITELGLPWTVELRTGDTSVAIARQTTRAFPTVLVTTPESLSLLLSYPGTREKMDSLRAVVVDEWHELLGIQTGHSNRTLPRALAKMVPRVCEPWGLSATLGNLEAGAACPHGPFRKKLRETDLGRFEKGNRNGNLIPDDLETFPWAGHLGLNLLPQCYAVPRTRRRPRCFSQTRARRRKSGFALCSQAQTGLGE